MARRSNAAVAEAVEAPVVATVAPAQTSAESTKWAVTESDAKLAAKVNLEAFTSKSAQMRALQAAGLKTGPISRILSNYYSKEVKYQHVRNVLMQPAPNKDATPTAE